MSPSQTVSTASPPRRVGRSILALLAGFVANIVLSLATDVGLQAAGILPVLGQETMNNFQSALAAAYRTVYCVLSSYIVARLAPCWPMAHALIGAGAGMVIATVGAIVTWNKGLGPHWYVIVLIVLALPTGWLGGKLRLIQMQ
jgi:hypothetical protein